jgi:hypothetical protein
MREYSEIMSEDIKFKKPSSNITLFREESLESLICDQQMIKYEKFMVDRNFITSVLRPEFSAGTYVSTTSLSVGDTAGVKDMDGDDTYVSTESIPRSDTGGSSSTSSTDVSTDISSINLNFQKLSSIHIEKRLNVIKKVARRIKSLATCNPFSESLTTINNKGNSTIIDIERKKIVVNYLGVKRPLIDTISIVENSLYERANCLAYYSDMNTIDLRIRNLLLGFVGMSDEVYKEYCYNYIYRYDNIFLNHESSMRTFSADLFSEYSENLKDKEGDKGNDDGGGDTEYQYWNNENNEKNNENEKINDINNGHENDKIDSTYVSTSTTPSWQDLIEKKSSSVKEKTDIEEGKYEFRIKIRQHISAILRDVRTDLKNLTEEMITSVFYEHIQHLEMSLYKEALSYEDYNDLNTLKTRLLDLMARIETFLSVN